MDSDKLERLNQMDLENSRNALESTRARIERRLSKMDDLAIDAILSGLADQDVNVRLKAAAMYLDRVVPKVAVRSVESESVEAESEAKKMNRMEIEELLRKKNADES